MRTLTPDAAVRAIVINRWKILVPFAIGLALVPVLARFAPELFRSETMIMVVPQRVPDEYVKATVTQSIEDRLPAITEQILSRSRLERIIQELDLYPRERATQVMEDVVAKMRKDVTIATVGGREVNSFRVSYVSDNADTAQKVTERLASLYIEQNLTDRSNQAESTSQFLGTQLEDAKRRLIEQEKKLEDYRRRHSGELPTQMQSNLQAIQGASLQLQALTDSAHRAQERRLLIERQIADSQAVPVSATMPASGGNTEAPPPANTAQQLEFSRARLAALLQRYTPDHPEVRSLQRTIEELNAKLGEETPLSATEAPPEQPLTPAEAMQKKRILDLQAELAVIDRQLATIGAEQNRLKSVIAAYQTKVDAAPSRESELVELTRDYSTLQAAYASLLMKREDSQIAANLERRQIGEQFRILDPASRPERPSNQVQRLGIMLSGALVGLVLGLVLVGYRELLDTSFRSEEEVHTQLKLPVLALIPVIASEREREAERRRTRMMDLAGSAAMLAAVAVVVVWRFQS